MWPDLPPDLLGEISTHLHDAADFVRFHAVCKPWRESHDLPTRKKTTTDHQFLPWLLACNMKHDKFLKFRCVFSKSSYRAPPPPAFCTGKNWVASADGTAVRQYFAAGPALHDPLTRDVNRLPPFTDVQWEEENPSGIIYKDGTVLLYSAYIRSDNDDTAEFRAALLRPGDDEWTVVQRTIESLMFCIAYHSGKILYTMQRRLWHVLKTTTTHEHDVLVRTPPSMPLKDDGYYYEHGHVLESCGELLWASVHTRTDFWKEYARGACDLSRALSVRVHALQDGPDPRWVRKKGMSLANLVLFLGWPSSFSVDASRLGINGGCAYFTHCENESAVYRYSFIDNATELVERLPHGWHRERCTWLVPQPTIAPLRQGCLATTPRSNSMIRSKKRRRGP